METRKPLVKMAHGSLKQAGPLMTSGSSWSIWNKPGFAGYRLAAQVTILCRNQPRRPEFRLLKLVKTRNTYPSNQAQGNLRFA